MQPRRWYRAACPIYRWKSFWLGLVIAGLVTGAWAISINRASGVQLNMPGAGSIALAQFIADAGIFYNGSSLGGWDLQTDDVIDAVDPVFEEHWRMHSFANGVVVLPHSQILVVVLLVWSAFLVWRWRRLKSSPHDTAPAP